MKIVCDKNVVLGGEAFAGLGDVSILNGRTLRAEDVKDADILIVRSTTKVNAALLNGSQVRFCGSAVIGTDHLDIPYLEGHHIAWASAPGCNAESVANYFTAALLQTGIPLAGKTVGIIGVGHVGKRIAAKAEALGLRVICNDPPRTAIASDTEAQCFIPLEELLKQADIVTVHTPLTADGPYPTHHLINAETLALMKPGAVFINAARGAIVDTPALLDALKAHRIEHAIIDCWEDEPLYSVELLHRAHIATPHIAGHSYEGKVNGTKQVYLAACEHFGMMPDYPFDLPEPPVPRVEVDALNRPDEEVLREIVLTVYNIIEDDQTMRAGCTDDHTTRRQAFDYQRSSYPIRREFASTEVALYNSSDTLRKTVAGLGFKLAPEPVIL